MDVKTIGIEVQQKGIVATTNSLTKLATAAQAVVKPVQGAVTTLAGLDSIDLTPVTQQFKLISQGVKEAGIALSGITSSASGIKGLSSQFTAIASAAERMGNSVAGLSAFATQLEKIKGILESIKALGPVLPPTLPNTNNPGGGGGGGGGGSGTKLTEQEKLMRQLERQTMMIEGRTKAGYLELRAAQLGVTQQAAPFIQRMREAEAGLNNTGMSAKQTAWALKMVPAQFTDIATQLAGGQSPFLVMLQQGGQLRDMFHGFGNMFKQVGVMILKWLMNPWVLAAVVVAAFGFAIYKAVTRLDAMNQAMALTNSYTGLTKEQFLDMTASVAQATNNFYGAKDAMLALVSSGIRAGDNFSQIAEAVTNFSRYTGTATEDTVKWYAQIQKTPLDTLRQFDDQYHGITSSTLEHVAALQKSGDVLGAVKVATEAVIEAQDRMAKEAMEKANIFVKAYRWVADEMSKAFTPKSQSQEVASLDDQIVRQKAIYAQVLAGGAAKDSVMAKTNAAIIKNLEDQKSELTLEEKITAEEQKKKNTIRDNEDFLKLVQRQNETASGKGIDKVKAAAQQLTIEKQITQLKALQATTEKKQYDSAMLGLTTRLADVKKRQEPDKPKRGGSGTNAIASAMAELQKQQQLNQQLTSGTYVSTDKMTEDQKKLLELENVITLSKQKGSNVTKEQVALASKLIPIYKQAADLSIQNQKMLADNKEIEKAKKKNEEIDLTIAALKEEYEYLDKTKKTTDSRTAAEKESVKYQAMAKTAASEQNKLVFQTTANKFAELALQEKKIKNELETNKAVAATVKLQTDYRLEVQAAEEAEANSLAWMHLSSVEQEKRNSLQSIEVTRRKEIADLEDKISQAYAEGNAGLAEQLRLQEQSVNARAAGLSNVVRSKPILSSKEGTGVFADLEAASVNFWNSLESRAGMMQEAWSSTFQTMGSSLQTFTETGKLDFKSFTVSILKNINQMLVQFLMLQLAQKAVGLVVGSMSGSTGSNPSAGVGVGDYSSLGMWSGSGVTASGSAKGNVFGSMTNQVYTKTTPFKFAKGGAFGRMGVLGEGSKPEAVVPLARTSSGELGIQAAGATGSGSNNVSVVVNVTDSGSSSSTKGATNQGASKLGDMIGAEVMGILVREKRPGGILA